MTIARKGITEIGIIFHRPVSYCYQFSAILEHIANSKTENLSEKKFNENFPLDSGILNSRCGKGCIPFMEVSEPYIILKISKYCVLKLKKNLRR